uniref:Uncharacterized protein n=1 Tax=Rhizophora mucronata TaxID=61149 RepID=A0A2P2IJ87_RHIMU
MKIDALRKRKHAVEITLGKFKV